MSHTGKVLKYNTHDQSFNVEGRQDRIDLIVDDFQCLGIKDAEELVGCVVSWERDQAYLSIASGVKILERIHAKDCTKGQVFEVGFQEECNCGADSK